MATGLFYSFAALTLVCGLLVVANPFSRNPVTSAMFLVLTIVSLAGLFVMLHAYFLAAVQILVYAGAVMVLFLFVIMLLNPGEERRRAFSTVAGAQALLAAGALAWILLKVIDRSGAATAAAPAVEGGTTELGRALFTRYLLPFEVVSVVLLVAMVGVVLLSKKNLK